MTSRGAWASTTRRAPWTAASTASAASTALSTRPTHTAGRADAGGDLHPSTRRAPSAAKIAVARRGPAPVGRLPFQEFDLVITDTNEGVAADGARIDVEARRHGIALVIAHHGPAVEIAKAKFIDEEGNGRVEIVDDIADMVDRHGFAEFRIVAHAL